MNTLSSHEHQQQQMKTRPGFIAALDQSGGSTPKALAQYGIKENAWSNDDEMFAIVHQMRTRIITSPSFTGERIIAAILFENTMDRDIEGRPTADYLWNVKRVVPFLKVDEGLEAEKDGVQLMKPMPELDALYRARKAQGFVVLGVSIDGPGSAAAVRAEVSRLGVSFPILLDEESRAVSLYNPRASAPFSVLIGRDGRVLAKREGYTTGSHDALVADVDAALR